MSGLEGAGLSSGGGSGAQGPQGAPGPATGPAGGVLDGTYPDPGFAADPVFDDSITLDVTPGQGALLGYRILNGDDNIVLTLGTGQAITDQTNQTYMSTLSAKGADTTGAGAAGTGVNIGQFVITATDGAAGITRTGQWATIEADFIQFQQSGGTAIFDDVVTTRFRMAIPKTGVTLVDNKGIDFVVPNAGDVTGAVTNYVAVNIPALAGGGGTNFYGIRLANAPNGGSLASVSGADLILRNLGVGDSIRLRNNNTDVLAINANGAIVNGTLTNAAGAWQVPTLLGTWANVAGSTPAGYRLTADGLHVELAGVMTGTPTGSNPFFQLPAGFRPITTKVVSMASIGASGDAEPGSIDTSGNVLLTGFVSASTNYSVDGIVFPLDR